MSTIARFIRLRISARFPVHRPVIIIPYRTYASSKHKDHKGPQKAAQSTATLIPGSQIILTGEPQLEYERAETKMQAAVEWLRKEVKAAEVRATGRVTPAVLSPVRVDLPGRAEPAKLDEIATVGVRDGTTLIITVFEEDTLKHIEKAVYAAKLPHIVPQKADSRTIKIPIPKPTIEARTALVSAAQKQAEDTRVQVRRAQQASLKKGKYAKHSVEIDEFQKLTDRYVGEVDKILTELKKNSVAR